jgi:LacI family transcriptional regulator
MAPRATMADVAREAGVSPSTASRVIYDNGYASKENRDRVLAAANKVGYRPNIQARSLRNQRSYAIGLIVDSATSNPHVAHIAHALRTEAAALGYSLLTVDHEYSAAMERDGLKHLLDHNVEAIAVCHPFKVENFAVAKRAKVPLIQVERRNLFTAHRVEIDPKPGIFDAVSHLVDLNHTSVAYIGGVSSSDAAPEIESIEVERVEAFRRSVANRGLSQVACPVQLVPYDLKVTDVGLQGYSLGRDLLRRSGRPTAIIVGSDVLAAGILQAAYELGISVPGELSLIGFDDSIAQFLAPPLSTIVQPHRDIARNILKIMTRMNDAGREVLVETVPTHLQVRKSTGPSP